ncbi:dynamin family protein [Chroococcidiopsis sp. TS-821]|uniref:dynamin family protein n=1 Tax=Chroococcidiopsis sp. TS-821 TaxID=1378066 RepID=UPI000CEEDD85|nr:dynamin family protein [Chroococcidiopsis sp. TS-821]PPS42265.1 hypothetical protein B1A85_14625 [Chroococcidiopsis sp. TS-821]
MNQTLITPAIIDYKKTILALLSYLQKLKEFSQKLNLDSESIDNIFQRLEVDSFSLAVVGEFNRGKSTFINALVGHDILPSDILATTATLSRITHRSTPGAKILFKDGREQEIAFHELANYATKLTAESAAAANLLKEVVIYYPWYFCQDNVEIIDTPGLSDDADMTAVTLSALRQCDMVIMLISPLSPFSISESEFLTSQLLDNGIFHILFVVNGIDRCDSLEDVEKLLLLIKGRIKNCIKNWAIQSNNKEYIKQINIQIFGISALQALQAKQVKDINLLAQSRLTNFEYSLTRILQQEREIIRLEITTNQLLNSTKEILRNLKEQNKYLELEQANLRKLNQIVSKKISIIRCQKTEVEQLFENTLTSVKSQSKIADRRLHKKLISAVERVIQSIDINTIEQSDLANKILDTVQSTSSELAHTIQKEAQEALLLVWSNIKDFVELFEQSILQITPEITQLGLDTTIYTTAMNIGYSIKLYNPFNQQSINTLSLLFPSNLEVFIFTQPEGIGTTIGAVLGFVLTAGTPIGAAIGGAIGAGVGANVKANKFKEKYQPQVMAEIEKQLNLMNVNQTVDNYISSDFSDLEKLQVSFIKEVMLILDTTQTQLAQKYGKHEAMILTKHQALKQIRSKLQIILHNLQQLSEQISQQGT